MPDTNLSAQVRGRGWFGVLAALALGLSACSNGDVISKRYELPSNLLTVTVNDDVSLKLVQDNGYFAEVKAGEKVIDDIKIEVSGTSLSLKNTSSFNWTRSYDTPREVTLHLPRLRNLYQRGNGLLSSAGVFQQDTMFLHLIGAGDIDLDLTGNYLNTDLFELGDMTLRGRMGTMILVMGGNGRFFADGLQTERCFFQTNRDSNGDVHVRVSEAAIGTVAGKGTFYYSGNPANTGFQITGGGRVVRQ